MNQTLSQVLLEAASKALKGNLSEMMPKTAVRKLDPGHAYDTYDLSLGEFYIPGRTRREEPSEEQKMVLGLKAFIKTVQDENTRLRTLVKSERDKYYAKGMAEGLEKGRKEGYEKGKADLQSAVGKTQASIAAVLKDFAAKKDAVLNRSERMTLEIVFTAVERILHRECRQDRTIVLNVIKSAIQEAGQSDKVTVKVNPKEVEPVNQAKDFWLPINNQFTEVKVVEDARVGCGGVMIETGAGTVDATLATQLENIRALFLKSWEQSLGKETA